MTDEIDGTQDNAGALLASGMLQRAGSMGLNARLYLANNDGYGFFSRLGDLVVTGPTLSTSIKEPPCLTQH